MALNVLSCGRDDLSVIFEAAESHVARVAQQSADLASGVIVVDSPHAATGPGLVGAADRAPVALRVEHGVVLRFRDAKDFESSQPRDARLFRGGPAGLDPSLSYPLTAAVLVVGAVAVLAVRAEVTAALHFPRSELVVGLIGIATRAMVHMAILGNQSDTVINSVLHMVINVAAVVWL